MEETAGLVLALGRGAGRRDVSGAVSAVPCLQVAGLCIRPLCCELEQNLQTPSEPPSESCPGALLAPVLPGSRPPGSAGPATEPRRGL
ncbi:hypothetical protein AAFF_G00132510 [Aldrovandia affinis]|uniref:Uncharacterized protein n=1 Tax=Aldrovandia affinis TaxID=143900 RepID=A0AAD7RQW9_9TELE|nr:hypothetical protein AAFF_G00132510 [Aldrovandia affinis]